MKHNLEIAGLVLLLVVGLKLEHLNMVHLLCNPWHHPNCVLAHVPKGCEMVRDAS